MYTADIISDVSKSLCGLRQSAAEWNQRLLRQQPRWRTVDRFDTQVFAGGRSDPEYRTEVDTSYGLALAAGRMIRSIESGECQWDQYAVTMPASEWARILQPLAEAYLAEGVKHEKQARIIAAQRQILMEHPEALRPQGR